MNPNSARQPRRRWWGARLVAGVLALALGVPLVLRQRHAAPPDTAPVDIRGEPIHASASRTAAPVPGDEATIPSTNAPATAPAGPSAITTNLSAAPPSASARRPREKPGSYPQRLVKSLAAGKGGAGLVDDAPGRLPPQKIVPIPPMPPVPGFRPVTFAQLASFPFKVDDALAFAGASGGSSNVAALARATAAVRAQIPEDVQRLHGQKVALQGFLVPLRMDEGRAVEFLLVRDQTFCCYGQLPQANEWVLVLATPGVKPDMDVPLTVCGRLHVGDHREEGVFVGVYRMDAERILTGGP